MLYEFRSNYIYANFPYIMAAYVIEVLSGQIYEDRVRDVLLKPLGSL